MVKFYSIILSLFFILPLTLKAQNVGVGTSNPQERLDVNGAIKIGTTTNNNEGTIRYNLVSKMFEGRSDTGWIPFLGRGDKDWEVAGDDMYSGVVGNVGIGLVVPLSKFHVTADSANTIYAVTTDSTGAGIFSENSSVNGGDAARFLGDLEMQGALRNSDTSLFGGSVAVNDGLTVGNISGLTCFAETPTTGTFIDTTRAINNGVGFLFFNGLSQTWTIVMNADSGQCKSITNLEVVIVMFDIDNSNAELNVDVFISNEYIGSINGETNGFANTTIPSNFLGQDTADGGFYTRWYFANNFWKGKNPDDVSWFIHAINYGFDSDYLASWDGTLSYDWGDSSGAPKFAAFGEVRASGTLYANSTSPHGDVAEFFKVDKSQRAVEVGDIVSIQPNSSQMFALTNSAYDPLIAGVISENPSVFLNDPRAGEPIALTGRVKVKVNIEGGEIKSGDPITSSSILGVGMKAEQSGTIVGYALESFDGSLVSQGKIWMLIANGHYEKVKDLTNVVEGNAQDLGGIEIKGSKKVLAGMQEVNIAWKDKLSFDLPDDIEFEDLVIELSPYGGAADLIVTEVNGKGFTVEVMNAAKNFTGFYYNVDLVSPKLHSAVKEGSNEMKAQKSTPIYVAGLSTNRGKIVEKMESLSGMSIRNMPPQTSGDGVKRYKEKVLNAWKSSSPELFQQFVQLGAKYQTAIANNGQSVLANRRK